MPGRREHQRAGAAVGTAAATLRAAKTKSRWWALEVLAGALGGSLGGSLPDMLEPAISSHHRDLWHSLFVGTALSVATFTSWESTCRARCTAWEQAANAHPSGSAQRREAEKYALLFAVAGAFLVGLAPGYALHLVMDGQTRRSIPLVMR